VVDSLGLDDARRAAYRRVAAEHGVPCVAVGFDVGPEECRARNRARTRPVPAPALKQQLARWAVVKGLLDVEGFDRVLRPDPVRLVPEHLAAAVAAPAPAVDPSRVRFGLHVSAFPWDDLAAGLGATAEAAEAVGFDDLWVMDHIRQIPQVGRDWDPILEAYTALAWMAARTTTVRLGALVTPVTFRNLGHLAKVIATLDVLSGGRARCGLGLGWYEREHRAYGWDFPSLAERYALLEDALEALPLLWGPGAKPYRGRVIELAEAIGYPRPLQERIPIVVGGGGEQRTLRLAARHADAVNVMGDLDVVRHKVDVLHRHLGDLGREREEVTVTHLASTLVGTDRDDLAARVDRLRPRNVDGRAYATTVNAGTIEDQVDRIRALAAAGVREVIVSLPDVADAGVERFGAVIEAYRR
jgi:F420-dependent oxidoreductase-like protein